MILRLAHRNILSLFLFLICAAFETQAQQVTVQLVNKSSDRFLYKLYKLSEYEKLPIELQHIISAQAISSIFSPLPIHKLAKTIPLPKNPDHNERSQYFIAFSPDSSHIAVTAGRRFYIFAIEKNSWVSEGHSTCNLRGICFNGDGTRFAALSNDTQNSQWGAPPLSYLRSFELSNYDIIGSPLLENGEEISRNGWADAIHFTPQGKLLLLGSTDFYTQGCVEIYDPESKRVEKLLDSRPVSENNLLLCKLSENKYSVIIISPDKGIEVFDITKEVTTLELPRSTVNFKAQRMLAFRDSLVAIPSLYTTVTASAENPPLLETKKCIVIKDIQTNIETELRSKHGNDFSPLCFSNKTHSLFTLVDKHLRLHNIKTGICIAILPITLKPDWACDVSSEGKQFALVTQKKLFLWRCAFADLLDDCLKGKITLEQLLFLKFLRDLKSAHYVLEGNGAESEAPPLQEHHLRPIKFIPEDIAQLKEVFFTFNEGVQEYLRLNYLLPF